jgi:hypothetical protein
MERGTHGERRVVKLGSHVVSSVVWWCWNFTARAALTNVNKFVKSVGIVRGL